MRRRTVALGVLVTAALMALFSSGAAQELLDFGEVPVGETEVRSITIPLPPGWAFSHVDGPTTEAFTLEDVQVQEREVGELGPQVDVTLVVGFSPPREGSYADHVTVWGGPVEDPELGEGFPVELRGKGVTRPTEEGEYSGLGPEGGSVYKFDFTAEIKGFLLPPIYDCETGERIQDVQVDLLPKPGAEPPYDPDEVEKIYISAEGYYPLVIEDFSTMQFNVELGFFTIQATYLISRAVWGHGLCLQAAPAQACKCKEIVVHRLPKPQIQVNSSKILLTLNFKIEVLCKGNRKFFCTPILEFKEAEISFMKKLGTAQLNLNRKLWRVVKGELPVASCGGVKISQKLRTVLKGTVLKNHALPQDAEIDKVPEEDHEWVIMQRVQKEVKVLYKLRLSDAKKELTAYEVKEAKAKPNNKKGSDEWKIIHKCVGNYKRFACQISYSVNIPANFEPQLLEVYFPVIIARGDKQPQKIIRWGLGRLVATRNNKLVYKVKMMFDQKRNKWRVKEWRVIMPHGEKIKIPEKIRFEW